MQKKTVNTLQVTLHVTGRNHINNTIYT